MLKVVSFVGIATTSQFPVLFCAAGCIFFCKADGKTLPDYAKGSRDLFMEVEDEVVWVNVYRGSDGSPYSRSYSTEETADAEASAYQNSRRTRINDKAYKIILNGDTE